MKKTLFAWALIFLPNIGIAADIASNPAREAELECGSDRICKANVAEQRRKEEDVDLEALEAKIIADGAQLKSAPTERTPQLVRRPSRPLGPRP